MARKTSLRELSQLGEGSIHQTVKAMEKTAREASVRIPPPEIAALELPEPLPADVDREEAQEHLERVKSCPDGWARTASKLWLVDKGVFPEGALYINAGPKPPAALVDGDVDSPPPKPQHSPRTRSLDAENLLLRGLIARPELVDDVREVTGPEEFGSLPNRRICRAIFALRLEGRAIDLVLVRDQLAHDSTALGTGASEALQAVMLLDPEPRERLLEYAALIHAAHFEEFEDRKKLELRGLLDGGSLRNGKLRTALIDAAASLAEVEHRSDWDPPLLDGMVRAEPFPLDVLPEPLARLIRTASEVDFFPPDFAAVPCLAVAGGGIGRTLAIQLKPSWAEFPLLFTGQVGDPGSTKTHALNLASGPAWKLQKELLKESRDKQAMMKRSKAFDPEDMPPPKRITVAEATCEAIALRLAENPRGLMMVHDELNGWVAGMNQYKSGGGNDRQFYLKVWSSSSIPIDRKGQPNSVPIYLPQPFLGLTGGMQPKILGALSFGQDRDDGLVDRILWTYPDAVPLGFDPRPIPGELLLAWNAAFQRLWSRGFSGPDEQPHVVTFSKAGMKAFELWCAAHCEEVNAEHFPRHMKGAWRKLVVYAARLALILDQLRWAYGESDRERPGRIGAETVADAARLIVYFKSHFCRVFASIRGGSTDDEFARSILDWLVKGGRDRFTTREARDNFRRRLMASKEPEGELQHAINWLLERGAIRAATSSVQRTAHGAGPPYLVNPHLTRKRAQKQEV